MESKVRHDDGGSVSVELALALPSVVLVLGVVLAGASWVTADIAATHAASAVARIALTEGDQAARATGARLSSGLVAVSREGDWIIATVTVPGRGPMPQVEAVATVPAQP